jgi:recombination protein RecA
MMRAKHLTSLPDAGESWSLDELAGRFLEVSGGVASACLTMACLLVVEAQQRRYPAAWVSATTDSFYPPDMAANGVDLAALPVIWAGNAASAARAASCLIRSDAFDLVIIDLPQEVELPAAIQGRLTQLAQKHATVVLCLTVKDSQIPSLGSLVSLRAAAVRKKTDGSAFQCELHALKDKRKKPGWVYSEVCRGPAGLC